MKDLKLKGLLELLMKANVIVVEEENELRFASFNHYINPEGFKGQVDKKYQLALFEHIDLLVHMKNDESNYLNCLEFELTKSLYEFKDHQGTISHSKLMVCDDLKNTVNYDDLSEKIKSRISGFLSVQKSALKEFLTSTCHSGEHSCLNQYRWTGSKIDLVELGNALYEAGVIQAVNGQPTKKDFIEYLSRISGLDIASPHKIINKAMNREKPSLFIDRLKSVLESLTIR